MVGMRQKDAYIGQEATTKILTIRSPFQLMFYVYGCVVLYLGMHMPCLKIYKMLSL